MFTSTPAGNRAFSAIQLRRSFASIRSITSKDWKRRFTGALAQSPAEVRQQVVGISIDTTGSTPGPVDETGLPLALRPDFAENPNGMFILWKDHTANAEAEEINKLAHHWDVDYTKYVGGIYSSEWFWAKMLRTLRVDEAVREHAFSWIEHCDWISAVLTGNTNPLTLRRSRCAAGHKALWHSEFDGLPSDEFLTKLDPLLSGLRDRLFTDTYTADQSMGNLSAEWAEKLGLSTNCSDRCWCVRCTHGRYRCRN
jgi:L-ribulokinase